MLDFVTDDLQMLELDNPAYGEAFEYAIQLKALVDSISAMSRRGSGDSGLPLVYQ